MNTQNLEFLKKSLLNLGFGDKVNRELEQKLSAGTPEFTLLARHEFNQQPVDYHLHFKAGDKDGMYFFNKYDTVLQGEGTAKGLTQTFYINRGNGITAKEGFNLMEGRAVYKQLFTKEGQKYQAWLQLDKETLSPGGDREIKRFGEGYGFDLAKAAEGKGIKELETPDGKLQLMRSQNRGNLQQITVARENGDAKYFIAASPQFKTVDLYNDQGKRIKREELLQRAQKPEQSQKQKQQKEELPAKKQQRRSKMNV